MERKTVEAPRFMIRAVSSMNTACSQAGTEFRIRTGVEFRIRTGAEFRIRTGAEFRKADNRV